MRGRYSAAIWLFALLAAGMLAVGFKAPKPRDSAPIQAARARLLRAASELAPSAEDASLHPEQGCLRDRTTGDVYRRNSDGEWAAYHATKDEVPQGVVVTITPCCDAADPSARDFALAELAAVLRTQWQAQGVNDLQPATIVYVAQYGYEAEFSWERWQNLLLPGLSISANDVGRQIEAAWDAVSQQLPRWAQLIAGPSDVSPITPIEDAAWDVSTLSDNTDPTNRIERSILVRRQGTHELAEREEHSVLLKR